MAKLVYARSGDKLVRKYRCTSGRREGKIVATPQQCNAPIDLKKKARMKRLHRQKGKIMAIKRKRTKNYNPVSKQVARLNKVISRNE